MNYHTEITLTTPTPEQWTAYLVAHAQELGLPHLDLLLDCANIHPAIFNPFIPLRHSLQTQELLALTPHDDAAKTGPMLIRIDLSNTQHIHLLQHLLFKTATEPRILVLFSTLDFIALANHLACCLQVEWQDGLSSGVLRFNDPRLFLAIINQLSADTSQQLLQPVQEWHWLNRDQHAVMLLPPAWDNPILTSEPLQLRDEDIDVLSAWHEAELWRQRADLQPAALEVETQEAMMQKLVQLQLKADQAKLWAVNERQGFLSQMIHTEIE